jgi:hypothetical protein
VVYPDGNYYEGHFFENMIQGFGVMYNKQGCPLYQGYWRANKYDGDGILYNINPE